MRLISNRDTFSVEGLGPGAAAGRLGGLKDAEGYVIRQGEHDIAGAG